MPTSLKIYAAFDDQGVVTGFWPEAVYPAKANGQRNASVPETAVPITDEDYRNLTSDQSYRWADGAVVRKS